MVKRIEHSPLSQCPVACTLDIVGDHWTLLIIRNMMFFGTHEYKDFLAMDEGISSNILSDRLKNLEKRGMISSVAHPESKRRKLYYLTKKAKNLVYVMIEIVRWADQNLGEFVHIPNENRVYLDTPVDDGAQIIFKRLKIWENEFL